MHIATRPEPVIGRESRVDVRRVRAEFVRAHESGDGFGRAMAMRGDHGVAVGDLQLELRSCPVRLPRARNRLRHLDRLAEMRDRLLEGRAPKREVAGFAPIFDRGRGEARLREVVGE